MKKLLGISFAVLVALIGFVTVLWLLPCNGDCCGKDHCTGNEQCMRDHDGMMGDHDCGDGKCERKEIKVFVDKDGKCDGDEKCSMGGMDKCEMNGMGMMNGMGCCCCCRMMCGGMGMDDKCMKGDSMKCDMKSDSMKCCKKNK
ncbi:MAG TPA: hypothetical protein VFU15_15070 [Bacteroidia bacterium]|nr:hypothetical protein [Bacteroidia bacterium]